MRDLERLKKIAREAYPDVTQVSAQTVGEWMEKSEPLLLVDVRSPEEFAVSHLRGAINARSAEQIAKAADEYKASKMIWYCSVGFRSSRMAHIVSQRRIGRLMNLEGSIFEWANEGREIYRGEVPVKEVHPYGKRWTGLLEPGLAVLG